MKKLIFLHTLCFSLFLLIFISGCNPDKRENSNESDNVEVDTSEIKTIPVPKADTQILDVSVSIPPPPPPEIPPIKFEKPPLIGEEEVVEVSPNGYDEISAPKVESHAIESDEEKIYAYVEQMPEFPGGQSALYKFIADNIVYPGKAREEQIQGKANVRFVVDKDGRINNVSIVKSSGNVDLDKEAVRIIKVMPNWKAGKQNGRAVRVYFMLPVKFKLED